MSVGIAHTKDDARTPCGIIVSWSVDGCGTGGMVISKEVARSIAKMLIGLADDMDATAPSPRPGSVVVVQP